MSSSSPSDPPSGTPRLSPGQVLASLGLVVAFAALGVAAALALARSYLREPPPAPSVPTLIGLTLLGWSAFPLGGMVVTLLGIVRPIWRVAATGLLQTLVATAIALAYFGWGGWLPPLLLWAALLLVSFGLALRLTKRMAHPPQDIGRSQPTATGREPPVPESVIPHGSGEVSSVYYDESGRRICTCDVVRTCSCNPVRVETGRGGGGVRACRCVPVRGTAKEPPVSSRASPRGQPLPEAAALETLRRNRRTRPAGTSPEPPGKTAPTDPVDVTVFAPPWSCPGASFFVQAFAHRPEQAAEAEAMATEFDEEAKRRAVRRLEIEIARGTRLQFHLTMPGLEVDDPVQELTWQGRPDSVQFGVTVPDGMKLGTAIGTLAVSQDSVPIGHVKFQLKIVAVLPGNRHQPPEPVGAAARRYQMAFISYASADRPKILARVQMLTAVGIRYFQDVLDLEPGARWERELYRRIDECDLFLLFWSKAARDSEWVLKEVNYALSRKGQDELKPPEIRPVILDGPPLVPPPPELAHLHFNDRVIYLIAQEPV